MRLHIEWVDHAREAFGRVPTLGMVRAQPRVVSVLGEIDCETLNQARALAELRKLGEGQTLELLARTDPGVGLAPRSFKLRMLTCPDLQIPTNVVATEDICASDPYLPSSSHGGINWTEAW